MTAKPIPTPDGIAGLKALQAMMTEKTALAALQVFHRELGDVFQINFPGFRPIMLVGPEAAEFVLVEGRDQFLWRAENEPITNLLHHGLLVVDGDLHDRLRKQMNPSLHRKMLAEYVTEMWQTTDEIAATWTANKPPDMLDEMRRAALLILMRTLFKVDFSAELETLWPAILKMMKYVSPGAWLLWRDIPRPGYTHALQQVDDYLYEVIHRRRVLLDADAEPDDMLGMLIVAGLEDRLIRDQMVTMLVAGHDTCTALLAWAWYLLGKHPDVMHRAQAEVDAVLNGEPPTLDSLSDLTYLEQIVQETLRLYPPAHLSLRIAAQDVAFQGYHFPAETRVLYSIFLSQRHPEYWPEPERFDPDRFTPDKIRERPHYVYTPFGGGPRLCIGYAFAHVEAKVVLARLLQTHTFKLALKKEAHIHMGVTLEPSEGVPMHTSRR